MMEMPALSSRLWVENYGFQLKRRRVQLRGLGRLGFEVRGIGFMVHILGSGVKG